MKGYISYKKLFEVLKQKKIKPETLVKKKFLAPKTLENLYNDKEVKTSVLSDLCDWLECDLFNIAEYITPEENARRIRGDITEDRQTPKATTTRKCNSQLPPGYEFDGEYIKVPDNWIKK
jgi:DNA-binding Xre family transcriptional regulator